jgi:hypothetical protein
MSVTPEALLAWAWSAHLADEVDGRASVSRAYYAAYHRCDEWHSGLKYQSGVTRQGFGDHEWLIQRLLRPNLGNPTAVQQLSQDLGDRLRRLKGVRTLADYHLRRRWPPGIENQACQEAEDILQLAV